MKICSKDASFLLVLRHLTSKTYFYYVIVLSGIVDPFNLGQLLYYLLLIFCCFSTVQCQSSNQILRNKTKSLLDAIFLSLILPSLMLHSLMLLSLMMLSLMMLSLMLLRLRMLSLLSFPLLHHALQYFNVYSLYIQYTFNVYLMSD